MQLLNIYQTVNTTNFISYLVEMTTTTGSAKGEEERDHIFGRLFGMLAVIQSEVLFRTDSTLGNFLTILELALKLYQAKVWLRESTGWVILKLLKDLNKNGKEVDWRDNAVEPLIELIYDDQIVWSPEKIGWTIYLQQSGIVSHLSSFLMYVY